MKTLIFAYSFLIFTLSACGQAKDKPKQLSASTKGDTTQNKTLNVSDYSPTFDNAHPNAKRLMTEEFYFSPIDETGPFGNDDGADTYAGFKDWRKTHKNNNPKEFLDEQIVYWGYPKFDINETDFAKLKPYLQQNNLGSRFMSGIDAAIVAIAFGQLYLEGTIDKDFKDIAKIAIKRQLLPDLLALWGDNYKTERETKLKKMVAVLNQVQ